MQEVETDVFVLVEGEEAGEESGETAAGGISSPGLAPPAIEEDEAESVMASAQDQREEELQVSYCTDKQRSTDRGWLEICYKVFYYFINAITGEVVR